MSTLPTPHSRHARGRTPLAFGALSLLSMLPASAATINQTVNGALGSNWNSAIWGNPAAAPTATNDYVSAGGFFAASGTSLGVDVTGRVRENGTTFGGDSFTLISGTELLMKQSNATVSTSNMILEGGVVRLSPDTAGSASLAGTITVNQSSVMGVVQHLTGTTLNITSTVVGGADLRVASGSGSGSDQVNFITFNGDLSGYTGTIIVGGGNRNLTLNFAQDYVLANMGLAYGDFASADRLNLTNDITLGSFSFGGTSLTAGTYTAEQLNTTFSSGEQFFGDATLTVIPEPSIALLCGIGFIGLLRRHR